MFNKNRKKYEFNHCSKLKYLRKQKGWSQEQASDYLKISQSSYARMESGESHSWARHLDKISEVFDISPEELVKNENVILNSDQHGGTSNNALIINQLSEKLIEQYEERIKELKEIIIGLRKQ